MDISSSEEDEVSDLFEAVEKGDEERAKFFIQTGQLNEKRTDETTPLHVAVLEGRQNLVELLLENGADINLQNNEGNSALHLTILNNRFEITQMIIENKNKWKIKIDPELENNAGKNLHTLVNKKIKKYREWSTIKDLLDSIIPLQRINSNINEASSPPLIGSPVPSSSQKRFLDDDSERSKKQKVPFKDYASSGVKTSLHGTIYQLQLLMLFAHRASNVYHYFELATEMDMAEKFDDVVIKYKKGARDPVAWKFLQAKHKQNPQRDKITMNNLTTTKDDDFSLQKYFLSFCKIKANPEFENAKLDEFILCTNTTLKREETKGANKWKIHFSEVNEIKNDEILYFEKYSETKKNSLNVLAKNNLSYIFKIALLDKIASKKFEQYKSIINYLNIFKLVDPELSIRTELTYAQRELNNNKKLAKTWLVKVSKQVLHLAESTLTNKEFDDTLKSKTAILNEIKATNKNDPVQMKVLKEALTTVEAEVNKIIDRIETKLNDSQQQFNNYLNNSSKQFSDLTKDEDSIKDVQNNIKTLLNNIENFNFIQMYDDISNNNLIKCLNKKTVDALKQPNFDLQEVKLMVQEDLQKTVTDFVAVKLLLDTNNFDSRLDEFINAFRLVTNYPNVDELNGLLRNMLGDDFKLLNADLVTDSFQKEILDWLKQYNKGRSNFLSTTNENNLICGIKRKIHTLMASGLSKAYPEKLKSYGLRFNDNNNNFDSWYQKLETFQCLLLVTNLTRFTAINVHQILESKREFAAHDSYILVRIRTLFQNETKKLLIESFNSEVSHHLLVIEDQEKSLSDKKKSMELIKDLKNILELNDKKKLIIISSDENILRNEFGNAVEYHTENIQMNFNNLSINSQKNLLKTKCNFQGNDINLNNLINYKTAQQIIDNDTLTLIVEKKLLKIGDKDAFYFNDYIQEYYIDRYLHRQTINNEVLRKEQFTDLLFITGVDEALLHKLGANKDYIYKYEDDNDYTTGILWCDATQDEKNVFLQICTENKNNIHWLECCNDILYWKKTNGDYSTIVKQVNTEYNSIKNYFHEVYFSVPSNLEEKILIISNDTGAGKSTILTSLAQKMKKISDSLWIFRINLNDFAFDKNKLPDKDSRKEMKSLGDITFAENDISESIDYFTKMVKTCNKFEKQLLKFSLSVTDKDCVVPNVVILFDGFDEISPTYSNETIRLIKALSKSNVAQMFITTRPHEQNLLENQFQCPAFILKNLVEKEQIEFLNNYWRFSLKFFKETEDKELRKKMCDYLKNMPPVFGNQVSKIIENIDNYSLLINSNKLRSYIDIMKFDEFSEQLLSTWKNKIKDNHTTFIVIPLHLRMLGEIVFKENFQEMENFHILVMYKKFVNIKYDIFYDEKKNLGNTPASIEIRNRDTTTLKQMFYTISFQVVLPDINISEINEKDNKEIDERDKIPLARTGLVILKGTRIDFIHRSFAGYFLSKYTIKNISRVKMQTLMLKRILLENGFHFIREFLNSLFERKESALKNIDFAEDAVNVIEIKYGTDNILHVIAHEGYIPTLKFLLDKILKYPKVLEKLLSEVGKFGPILNELIHHPVRKSIAKPGTIGIFLDKLQGFDEILGNVLTKSTETNGLIFYMSGRQTSFTIVEKIIATKNLQLLQTFLDTVKEYPKVLRKILKETKNGLLNLASALLSEESFFDCLNIIFDAIEDDATARDLLLSATADEKNTILHTMRSKNNVKFKNFLNWLSIFKDRYNNIVKELLITKNGQNFTVLEISVYMNGYIKAVDLLSFLKSNFAETIFRDIASNNYEENILFKAISQGKTESSEALLNWFYQNVDSFIFKEMILTISVDKRSALDLACARGFPSTIEVFLKFVKKINEEINFENILTDLITLKEGNTNALIEALYWKRDPTTIKLLEFLSQNVNKDVIKELLLKKNRFGENVVHLTTAKGTDIGLKNLLQFMFDILKKDFLQDILLQGDLYGNSILLGAITRKDFNTSKVLLDFIHQNLDISVLKTLVLKANIYGTAPLTFVESNDCLKENLEVLVTIIIDEQDTGMPIVDFTPQELLTLKHYLEKYSRRENKEDIINVINSMIVDFPTLDSEGASSSTWNL